MNRKTFDEALTDPGLYQEILLKLSKKELPRSRRNRPVHGLLSDPDWVVEAILVWIRSGDPRFSVQDRIELLTGEKIRVLYTSPWPDRIVQMAMQALLAKSLEPAYSKRLYSFRKGLGTQHAHRSFREFLQSHPGAVHVAKRDITAYGDSIVQEVLLRKIEASIEPAINPLFAALLRQAISPFYRQGDQEPVQLLKGIPSGSPLTPVLENLYLMEIDAWMDEVCESDPRCFYARFGDDIVLAHTVESEFLACVGELDQRVERLGLHYSEKKKINAHLGKSTRYIEWLGATFHAKGRISSRPKHFRSLYSSFLNEFESFIGEQAALDPNWERSQVRLKTGIAQFLDPRLNPALDRITLNRSDPALTKQLDENIRRYLVRWIARHFGGGKSLAWKRIRTLGIPSVNRIRRMRWRLS
jgi:retron-type reverse transcriptase